MTAFATADQLAATLGIDTPTDPLVLGTWTTALDDASGYLRTVIGQPITAGTVTLNLTTDERGEADIWLVPVTSITSITDPEGNVLTTDQWELVDQRLNLRRAHTLYVVELAYGYATIPSEIVRWTKVLANAQIQAASQGNLGLNTVTSVAIDDGKVTYSSAMTVMLPDWAAQWLKSTFGGPQ
jgi:hypothetical protein